jgi:hypothetical protein
MSVYHGSVRVLSVVFLAIGVALTAATLTAGGGPLSVGFVLGLAFLAVGCARLWIANRTTGR